MFFAPAVRNKQKGRASGVLLILTKHGIKAELIDTSQLWIIIKIKGINSCFILCSIYVSPSYNQEEALKLLNLALEEYGMSNFLIGGYFNSRISDGNFMEEDLANYLSLLSQRQSLDEVMNTRGEMLLEFMEGHGLIALNGRTSGDIPGQFTFISKVGNSVVDLVWSNLEFCSDVVGLAVSSDFLTSDHLPVVTTLDFKLKTGNNATPPVCETADEITRYIWRAENSEQFTRIMIMTDNFVPPQDRVELYSCLKNKIHETASHLRMTFQYKPDRKFVYNRNPWFNQECRFLKKEFHKQYRKWLKTRKIEDITKYLETKKQYFTLCKLVKKEKKKTYEENFKTKLRNVKNSSEFWKTVTKFKPKKENKCQQIPMSTWNEYLKESFPPLDPVPPLTLTDVTRNRMDADFDMAELNKYISRLKNGKSPGPDNLLNEYLKALDGNWRNEILSFLTFLFNGRNLPSELTSSYMFMLFKKGDSKNPNKL